MSTQNNPMAAFTPRRIDSPTKFSVYCSATEIFLTGWDVRISLMENLPPVDGISTAIVHGSIVLSPIHAKALAQAMNTAIAQYEEKFGILDVQKVLDAQNAALAAAANPAQ